ncbi:MAG: hypothetical protein GXY77_13830 [Fibrobacter sp.]|nr:hypothetical protein [Fibrobacter sp.]
MFFVRSKIILLLISLLILSGCGRQFTAVAPEGFAVYRAGSAFRAASHDRLVYRVKCTENIPYAEFSFWKEALTKRMSDAGYRVINDSVIQINDKDALFLELVAPLGDSDYLYNILMMVEGKKILLAEAAGEVEIMHKNREKIIKAFKSIGFKN